MRLIDGDIGDKELRRLYDVWNLAMAPAEGREIAYVDKNMRMLKLMRNFLKSMPTVDAVEVVRCGECAKWADCKIQKMWRTPDDFWCVDGERKDGEEK